MSGPCTSGEEPREARGEELHETSGEEPRETHADAQRRDRPTVRVGALILTAGGLLLVRQRRGRDSYWLLPGGGVKFGEPLIAALRRELLEELGLEIVPGRFLALAEAISDDMARYPKHVVHVICEARPADPAARVAPGDEAVLEARFFGREALAGLDLRPPIAPFLQRCFDELPRELQYLGVVW
jgi:8-oxo-dGTP diphosphatase